MDEETIRKYALQNAVMHEGKASFNAVLGHLIAIEPAIKQQIKEWARQINTIIAEINSMSISEQRAKLEQISPEMLEKKKVVEHKELPELPEVHGEVRMRLAPSPSGPLHIGHSRMAILNDEYVKRYGGTLFLRIEDTNPKNIDEDAYRMIPEDLDWLGVKYHQTITQSERFELYYEVAKKLLELGKSYITLCEEKEWRALKIKKKACPDRDLETSEQLERWDKMLGGYYNDGEAVYVLKTDLNHPNPAIRDWAAFRILKKATHPILKNRYVVYPLMNFAVAVDDHYLNLTHVIRGKDHLNNTYRQLYIFDYLTWPVPQYIHYGKIWIKDSILKTSIIKKGVKDKEYSGWDDPRLGTLKAIANRGINPEAIRKYWIDVGIKEVDVEFSWDTLYAYNREIVDYEAKRLFFVWAPTKLKVLHVGTLKSNAPLHPSRKELGVREYKFENDFELYLTAEDWNKVQINETFRLKDLCNVRKIDENTMKYEGNDLTILKKGAKIVHWVPADSLNCLVYMPEGQIIKGLVEPYAEKCVNTLVQMERFGFVNLKKNEEYEGYFAHR